jgi:hypothetical protein
MPPEPSNLITIERSILEKLLGHATSAARIVGHSDALAAGPLADHVDALVHELTELLGDPALRARPAFIDAIAHELGAVLGPRSKVMVEPSDCSMFALAVVRRDDVDTQDDGTEIEGVAP